MNAAGSFKLRANLAQRKVWLANMFGDKEVPAVLLEPKLQKEYRVAREHFNVEDIRLTTVNGTGAVCGQRKTFPRIVSCS